MFFKGIIDEVKVTADESYFLDDDVYMHGKHSWQVTGGSSDDLVVGQTLSSEVVEYIRQRQTDQNRGVCFSFWHRPDGVIESGEKNKAQAEICYYNGSWHTDTGDLVKPLSWQVGFSSFLQSINSAEPF